MTASALTYNVPVLSGPFDADGANSVVPTPSQMANGWIPSVDDVAAEQQNYLHNSTTSYLYLAQQLGLLMPFNPDPGTGLSMVGVPYGGIVSIKNGTGQTEFYVARNAMAAGFSDPSLNPANWALINFNSIATYSNPYSDGTGTADAVVGTYPSVIYPVLQDGFQVTVSVSTPNATTTPTFQAVLNGAAQTPRTIVKKVRGIIVPLVPGDLIDSCLLEYDLPNLVWVLWNPPLHQTLPGSIIIWGGASAPPGYLQIPLSLTNISRTAYAALFAEIGTTWGAGDGATTFALPYLEADFAILQANGNIGAATVGAVIAHQHTIQTHSVSSSADGLIPISSTNTATYGSAKVNSAGGANNMAAGRRFLLCIKY